MSPMYEKQSPVQVEANLHSRKQIVHLISWDQGKNLTISILYENGILF